MKATYIPSKPIAPELPQVPYLAHFPGPQIVLVTKVKHAEGRAEGYMLTSSECYRPFEYFSAECDLSNLTPVSSGKIIIDFEAKDTIDF